MRVLIHEWVTGGGLAGSELPRGWMTEGRAMRRAIAADFHEVVGIEAITTIDERFADESSAWRSIVVARSEEIDRLAALSSEVDCILLIAPETGGLLFDRAERLERWNVRSLGSTSRGIALTSDKLELARHLETRGIETPESRSFVVAEGLPDAMEYPVVVKPIDGAGSDSTFLVRDRADLELSNDLPERMLVQPFVKGVPMSASFLVSSEGSAKLLGVGRQRIETRGTRIGYSGGSMPEPDALAEGAVRAAVESVEGLRGFVGVDFIVDEKTGRSTVIEINPRPTTSFVGLQHRLGIGRIAEAWLRALGIGPTAGRSQASFSPSLAPFRFQPDGTIEGSS